jgi:hypothetical protein
MPEKGMQTLFRGQTLRSLDQFSLGVLGYLGLHRPDSSRAPIDALAPREGLY